VTSPLLPSLKADRCCLYAQAISDCGTDSPGEHVLVIGLTPPDQQRHRLLSLLPLTYSGQNTDAGDFNGFQLTVESGGGKFQGARGTVTFIAQSGSALVGRQIWGNDRN
jgi:hypothetical protein